MQSCELQGMLDEFNIEGFVCVLTVCQGQAETLPGLVVCAQEGCWPCGIPGCGPCPTGSSYIALRMFAAPGYLSLASVGIQI